MSEDLSWEGTLSVEGTEIRVAVLVDGTRVVNGDDFQKFILGRGETGLTPDLQKFMDWQDGTGAPRE